MRLEHTELLAILNALPAKGPNIQRIRIPRVEAAKIVRFDEKVSKYGIPNIEYDLYVLDIVYNSTLGSWEVSLYDRLTQERNSALMEECLGKIAEAERLRNELQATRNVGLIYQADNNRLYKKWYVRFFRWLKL